MSHSANTVGGPTPVAAPACEQPLHHVWDRDGEHCTLCGDPDWCASPICAGARCVANFELSRKDREHIAEYMTNHNKLRSEVGLLPVTNISKFLADKVMTDIRTELQTMRSSGRFASCPPEETRTAGESDR